MRSGGVSGLVVKGVGEKLQLSESLSAAHLVEETVKDPC